MDDPVLAESLYRKYSTVVFLSISAFSPDSLCITLIFFLVKKIVLFLIFTMKCMIYFECLLSIRLLYISDMTPPSPNEEDVKSEIGIMHRQIPHNLICVGFMGLLFVD